MASKHAQKKPPRLLTVTAVQQVTPLLRRIILTGDSLIGFPEDRFGAHLKVFLPREGQTDIHLPTIGPNGLIWPPADKKPIARTYSVRYYDPDKNHLAIDFVRHGHNSPAASWAERARKGDQLGIAGPGGPHPLIAPADFHVIAGDMTALPAISSLLEYLPEKTEGDAFIEIVNQNQIHNLINNTSIQVHWVTQEDTLDPRLLFKTISNYKLPTDLNVSAWVAGENSSVIEIRDYLRKTFSLTKKTLYAVPYWRRGDTEEEYHQDRHKVMDQEY